MIYYILFNSIVSIVLIVLLLATNVLPLLIKGLFIGAIGTLTIISIFIVIKNANIK